MDSDIEPRLPAAMRLAGLVALALFSVPAPWGWCQLGFRNRTEDPSQEQILLAPRPLARLLREGKVAIDEMRYADGIEALGAILLQEKREDLPDDTVRQDYFIELGGDHYYKNSVRGEALRLLGSIPEEGRKTLEIQYGVSARQELQSAVGDRNMEAIGEVARKYYHTDAGYDANILLAQDKLIRGYPIAAAGILEKLLQYPAARKRFGAQLTGEVAGAWMMAERKDLAIKALEKGEKLFPKSSVMLGGRQVALDNRSEWSKVLDQLSPRSSDSQERPLTNWLMTGGEPGRNGTASAGLPLPTVAWDMTLHRDRSDEEDIAMAANTESQSGSVLVPKLEARMIGDLVLSKTATGNIFAIDLNTGLRMWPFYKDGTPINITRNVFNMPTDAEEALLNSNLRNRVWGSTAFGQFTIDNNQLYYITSSDEQRISMPAMMMPRGSAASASNLLIGVSLQAQGKELWQIGGEKSESEPALAGAYFLGPPLSYEGELYVLAEINMETRLMVLDARTGKLQWSQQLTLSPMAPIRSDMLRQSQALTPSISDTVILCPVGNGALVAVDLLTRSLMWAKQYALSNPPRPAQPFNAMGDMDDYEATEERWQEPQVLVSKGKVIFTPPEASIIMCLDLMTGVPAWQQARQNYRYVAGVYNDQIIVVSNTHVFALNMEGRPSWPADVSLSGLPEGESAESATRSNAPMRERETIAGKSVRDGRFLYVPTSQRRVLKIDLQRGRMVGAATVEQPLGNLFAFKDRLISVGATRISAYYTRDALTREVEQRLAANSNDTWALNQRSLIYMADHRTKDAIDLLRKSYELDKNDGETRYLLASALMSGLEEDFNSYLPIATELEPIIETQHFRFLVLLARGNLKAGQYELAFNRLMELVQVRSSNRQPSMQARMETMNIEPGYSVDLDAWIATQLSVAISKASDEERARMLKQVSDRLVSMSNGHPMTRENELRFLAWLDQSAPALIAIAQSQLGDTDPNHG